MLIHRGCLLFPYVLSSSCTERDRSFASILVLTSPLVHINPTICTSQTLGNPVGFTSDRAPHRALHIMCPVIANYAITTVFSLYISYFRIINRENGGINGMKYFVRLDVTVIVKGPNQRKGTRMRVKWPDLSLLSNVIISVATYFSNDNPQTQVHVRYKSSSHNVNRDYLNEMN